MNFKDGSGKQVKFPNGVTCNMEEKKPEGIPIIGEVFITKSFRKPMGECNGVPFYHKRFRCSYPSGYVLTDSGCAFGVYKGDLHGLPVVSTVAILAILITVPAGLLTYYQALNTGANAVTASQVESGSLVVGSPSSLSENSAFVNGNVDDIKTGELSPSGKKPVDFEEVKPEGSSSSKSVDETVVTAQKQLPFQWNLTPTLKEGRLHIRFAPTGTDPVRCTVKISVDGDELYSSGIVKSGQFIEYATVDRELAAGTYKGTCAVRLLTESNSVYSSIILPLDKVIVK